MFEYDLQFRNIKAHSNVDVLSRLPLTDTVADPVTPPELVFLLDHLDSSPATSRQIKEATRRDPKLVVVMQYTQ